MTDDHFHHLLRDAAKTYHRPTEPPLDAMWHAIEAGRAAAPHDLADVPLQDPDQTLPGVFGDRAAHAARRPTRSWIRRALPIAAVFLGGIALGRVSARLGAGAGGRTPAQAPVRQVAQVPVPLTGGQIATSRYLGQTAALLIALPTELRQPRADSAFSARASDLLLTTRLLMDSPAAASDSSLHSLFEDLELVLAQVVRLQHDRTPAEIDLINQALEQRDVLPRLRTAAVGYNANEE